MADHDSLSDSSDDEDYVPEGGSDSEGVCGSASEEEERDTSRTTSEGDKTTGKKGRRRRHQKSAEPAEPQLTEEEARQVEEEERKKIEKQEEKRIDDLWSSFKQDTSAKPRPPVAIETSTSSQVATTKAPLQAAGKTVTVIKTYDFAGEAVQVPTEIAVDSKEGKRLLSEQLLDSCSADEASANQPTKLEQAGQAGKGAPCSLGTKRGSGLSSVLAQISKKPKMTTLTKSKLDWDSYKKTQGLTDELAQGTKDGYLERKAFLERVDWREFELEKQERSKHFKRLM